MDKKDEKSSSVAADSSHTKTENALATLTQDMFDKLSLYVRAQIEASTEDYELLQKLNAITATKYESMADKAEALVQAVHIVNTKYNSIKPHLKQIDELDGNIAKLEQLVQHLDVYSRRLEAQFKQIYRN